MPEAKKARYDAECPSTEQTLHTLLTEFRGVQEKLEHLSMQMSEKGLQVVRQVCQQYNAIREPYFASRAALVKKLPKFWTSVCTHHPSLSSLLSADDIEVLQYLTNVIVREYQDSQCGFRIEFDFDENPFFEEQQLIKAVTFDHEGHTVVGGTPPTWREHMGPGGKTTQDGQKRKCEKSYSFFSWFNESGIIGGGVTDQMSLVFKDDIWRDPMQYYHNPEPVKEADVELETCALPSEPQTETPLPGEGLDKAETEKGEKDE